MAPLDLGQGSEPGRGRHAWSVRRSIRLAGHAAVSGRGALPSARGSALCPYAQRAFQNGLLVRWRAATTSAPARGCGERAVLLVCTTPCAASNAHRPTNEDATATNGGRTIISITPESDPTYGRSPQQMRGGRPPAVSAPDFGKNFNLWAHKLKFLPRWNPIRAPLRRDSKGDCEFTHKYGLDWAHSKKPQVRAVRISRAPCRGCVRIRAGCRIS